MMVHSGRFCKSNGVNQGGVLSPLRFLVYLDELLHEQRALNCGCYMNGNFVGAVIYAADDITLIGPTRSNMMSLSNCHAYAYGSQLWTFYDKSVNLLFFCSLEKNY